MKYHFLDHFIENFETSGEAYGLNTSVHDLFTAYIKKRY